MGVLFWKKKKEEATHVVLGRTQWAGAILSHAEGLGIVPDTWRSLILLISGSKGQVYERVQWREGSGESDLTIGINHGIWGPALRSFLERNPSYCRGHVNGNPLVIYCYGENSYFLCKWPKYSVPVRSENSEPDEPEEAEEPDEPKEVKETEEPKGWFDLLNSD